ncbi:putative conjugal transfer proteinc [Janthinobacterium sp. HH104]|uniref:CpaF family protein n=1 Tax=Janthinobacterium aestuarii TaxID=2985511 RepID=A0ABZ2GMM3_9BURK|nr:MULTISPECIES: CpaF family protein [Janthinobacterium]MBW3499412.1 CpaF family protein [Janthinobacterium sp. NKUCC08_JDC]MCC7644742.1 CpaF family protein [Janthinobacterium sp. EB271-G4-3-1]MCC7691824.1 CpaF family protein [Janthinobacterium sp. EB271-G4-3-2]MDX8122833.1 CpaF family protein [Janthinobacterium sp. GMG2]OEZ80454.1 putative conjugal transfer proteinc [Janthinobacterium sp. HH104]
MTLRERLAANETVRPATNGQGALALHAYQELKKTMHQTILDRIDLERLKRLTAEQFKHELALLVQRVIEEERIVLNQHERHSLVLDIQHEMLGFGPLEPLLADASVSDILVNTCDKVYVERGGRLQLTDVTFHDNAHLMKIIEKIVSRVGRRVDESSPMVDARLPDGSRVNAIIPPLAVDGPILSIRRFAVQPLTIANLLDYKSLTPPMVQVLQALGQAKVNILISGGTGSGKTTLLNVLSGFIPGSERIVTIEDAAELALRQPHVVRLETRPPNIEGKGEVSQRALVRNALRMRPDRIILGEVRGAEALDMLQAMNTGHEGSLATIHSNTARDALARLENMVGMANVNLTPRATRQQICSAVTVVMQVSRLTDGARKLVSLQEVTGMEGDIIAMHEIFRFEQTGVDADGKVQGHFCATGVRPRFTERLRMFGAPVPDSVFDPDRIYE